jgi:hypothetical protein
MKPPVELSRCYDHTLRIETNTGGFASSFVINYKGFDWLITAAHVVKNRDTGEERPFKVLDSKGNIHEGLEPVQSLSPADVAVFHLWTDDAEDGSNDNAPEPHSADDVCPTRSVYLLGYPDINDQGRYQALAYAAQPSPFIVRAIVSGDAHYHGIRAWLLDVTAHFGFSGGPVILHDPESNSHQVLGVISGHVPTRARFIPGKLDPESIQMGGALPFCEISSGFSICFNIKYALTDIDAHLATHATE